jgi:predicted transcriptional regulator
VNTFEFAIIASGLDHEADDFEDRFFEAGCEDATIVVARGAIILQFAREGDTLHEAIRSAMIDVRRVGATVERVEPDYLVSLSEIAERAHLTRAAVSLYAKGERGAGFPHPIARVTTESPIWDWTDVAKWLEKRGRVKECVFREAVVFRSVNNDLEEEHKRVREYASPS